MITYVLVHGAWHGGWCWKKVTPLLRASGHDVFTPTLPGLGERSHLLSPEATYRTSWRLCRTKTCARSCWSGTATAAW
jgi:hypothetical protein